MIGIYKFENKKTHKVYIGQSVNIDKRKWEHLKRPSDNSLIDKRLKEYGEEAFYFEILELCKPEELDEKEKYWINYYDSYKNGYNLTKGGQAQYGENNIQAKLTEEQVLKIIELLKNSKLSKKEIANKFNVHINTIDLINRCKSWNFLHNFSNNIRKEALLEQGYKGSTLSGEYSKSSKITTEQALKIIEELKQTQKSLVQISKDSNISLNIVYDINRCKTWKHLHNYKHNIRQEYRNEVGIN